MLRVFTWASSLVRRAAAAETVAAENWEISWPETHNGEWGVLFRAWTARLRT